MGSEPKKANSYNYPPTIPSPVPFWTWDLVRNVRRALVQLLEGGRGYRTPQSSKARQGPFRDFR